MLEQVENRISGLEGKIDIKEKNRSTLRQDSKAAKGICNNSVTPSQDQTCESWASKKKKRCKPNGYVI
jgi:hypothetical protein